MTVIVDNKEYFDRKDLMDRNIDHWAYYEQFLTHDAPHIVARFIGSERIEKSTDPYMNDIPLVNWDSFDAKSITKHKVYKACNNVTYSEENRDNFYWSPSTNVCIAKAAARLYKEKTAEKG